MAKKSPAKKVVKKAATKKTVKKIPTKKPPTKAAKASEVSALAPGKVLYPEVSVSICTGDEALTAEKAKKLLGWEEEQPGKPYGDKILFTDLHGKKIRCWNNDKNRPFVRSNAELIAQEVLRKRWRLNGETMIIGKTGVNISCQHRLVGLIMAAQAWNHQADMYPEWTSEPTMECIIVFGIEEDDATVNTIDTGRPRTLSDVLYRSELFEGVGNADRKVVARICDYGVKTLWHRTGVDSQAYAPKRTHAEALDFIARHPRLLDAVRHIFEEDGSGSEGKKISKYLSPGYASAMLYLMGCCDSDGKKYLAPPSLQDESQLEFTHWDKAMEFWTLLAGEHKSMAGVRSALGKLLEDNLATIPARQAMLVKAWDIFIHDGTIAEDLLELKWVTNDDGEKALAECPTVGGIDVGTPNEHEEDDAIIDPEEASEEKKRIQAETAAKKATKKVPAKAASVPSPEPEEETPPVTRPTKKVPPAKPTVTASDYGQTVWVVDPETPEASWSGELIEIYNDGDRKKARVKVGKGFASAGKVYEVPFQQLSLTAPVV